MEYERFDLTGEGQLYENECVGLENLLGEENVKIRKITVTSQDHVYVFYESKGELVETETERLASLRSIAFEITKNAVYGKLTNAKQRNLYLCEFCHITKSDAEDVMELVKILEAEAEVMAELKEEEKRLEAVATRKETKKAKAERIITKWDAPVKERKTEELTEWEKSLERERKANERKHKKEMSK